ncbi:hypothetical protein [Streptomyces sp. NPDC088135]|uniref:hypothetical protein n=1 Tax=Streptomyces sp. NPDC088135 TaxID=3160993 RepID=UPI0034133554
MNERFEQRRDSGTPPGGFQPGAHGWSSPFDTDPGGPTVTYTVEQDGPVRPNRPPKPAARGGQLPREGPPALPRAPQHPAGQRPCTTRPKEPIPMTAAVSKPATAPAAAPGRRSPQHDTDINLNVALRALTLLTSSGMQTCDDCDELAA